MLAALALTVALAQPAPTVTLQDNTLVLPTPVTFDPGIVTLPTGVDMALEPVKAWLDSKSYVTTLRIEGHVAAGTPDAQAVSERRALAVARWLVAHGVACGRLLPVGFGDTKPVASGDTPEGRASNTRIGFVSAGLMGRAIGGMPMDGGGKVAGDPCASP